MIPIRQCIVNALLELPYEVSSPMFEKEIDKLKDIETIAMENIAYYRLFFSGKNNEIAFKALKSACDERMLMEVGKGIAWAESFARSKINNSEKEQKTDVNNI